MAVYMRNRRCSCARCRAHGLMGAAVLVTLGVLFLLDSNGIVWFRQSWPVLLLVIGIVIFFGRTGSTENHVQPYWAQAPSSVPTSGQAAGTAGPPATGTPAPNGGNNNPEVQP